MFGLFKKRAWKVCYTDKEGNAVIVRAERKSTADHLARQAKAEGAQSVTILEADADA